MKKTIVALVIVAVLAAAFVYLYRPDLLDRFAAPADSESGTQTVTAPVTETPASPSPAPETPAAPREQEPAAPTTADLIIDHLSDRRVYVDGKDVSGQDSLQVPPGEIMVTTWRDGRYSNERLTVSAGNEVTPRASLKKSSPSPGWTGFQGDSGRTGLADSKARSSFTLRWEGQVDDQVRSAPIIHGGMAFFASDTNFIRAVDLADGEQLWSHGIVGGKVSPAAVGDFVFAGNDVGRFEGFRAAKGKLRGTAALGSGLAGLAAVSDDQLLAATSGGMLLSIATRKSMVGRLPLKFNWEVTVPGFAGSTATPLVLGNKAILQLTDGSLVCISTTDGSVIWPDGVETTEGAADAPDTGSDMSFRFVGSQGFLTPTPAAAAGVLYSARNDRLKAINTENGSLLWERGMGGEISSSVSLAWGVIYIGCTDGSIRAFSADGGQPLFTTRLGREPIFASPVLFDGQLLAASGEGKLMLLDAFSGKVLVEDGRLAGAGIDATPAVWRGGILAINRTGRMVLFE